MWAIFLIWLAAVVALVVYWWRLHWRLFHIDTSEQSIREYLRRQRYKIDE